jgi:DNA-binding MarR family transcriptional regulator
LKRPRGGRWARKVLGPVAMNAIYFGAKRAFYGFLRITRGPLKDNGITAARFDLMYALHKNDPDGSRMRRRVLQSELWRALGVTPGVVCRMLKALEELGLIRRKVPRCGDRRQRQVLLTKKGRQCLREAYRMTVRWVLRFVFEVICFGKHRDESERLIHMDALEGYLGALREYCHDRATLYYAWGHPDD